jgi:hypothetical protein
MAPVVHAATAAAYVAKKVFERGEKRNREGIVAEAKRQKKIFLSLSKTTITNDEAKKGTRQRK